MRNIVRFLPGVCHGLGRGASIGALHNGGFLFVHRSEELDLRCPLDVIILAYRGCGGLPPGSLQRFPVCRDSGGRQSDEFCNFPPHLLGRLSRAVAQQPAHVRCSNPLRVVGACLLNERGFNGRGFQLTLWRTTRSLHFVGRLQISRLAVAEPAGFRHTAAFSLLICGLQLHPHTVHCGRSLSRTAVTSKHFCRLRMWAWPISQSGTTSLRAGGGASFAHHHDTSPALVSIGGCCICSLCSHSPTYFSARCVFTNAPFTRGVTLLSQVVRE